MDQRGKVEFDDVSKELNFIRGQLVSVRQQHYSTLYSDDNDVKEPGIYGAFGAPAARSLREVEQRMELLNTDQNMSNAPSDMFMGSTCSKMQTLARITDSKDDLSKRVIIEVLQTEGSQQEKDSDQITVLQKELKISGEVIDRQSRQI